MISFMLAVLIATSAEQDLARYVRVRGVTLPLELSNAKVVGEWYRGDGLGINLTISIKKDGTYYLHVLRVAEAAQLQR